MLIVQPCSDNVHLISFDTEVLIARDRVEYDLSSVFLRISEGQDVLFVSGPGSFTNLRVAWLVINLARRLVSSNNSLFAMDKIALYALLVEKKFLPWQGIIYIGQTKNFWLYDFVQKSYTVVGLDSIPDGEYFVDQVSDKYFATLEDKKIVLSVQWDELVISFAGIKNHIAFADMSLQSVEIAAPEYMIEPVIG